VAKVFNGPDVFPIIQPTTSNQQSPITSIKTTKEFIALSSLLYLLIAAVSANVSFGDVR